MNIDLSPDLAKELRRRAKHMGVKPEELASAYLRVRLRRADSPVSLKTKAYAGKAMILYEEPPDEWWNE